LDFKLDYGPWDVIFSGTTYGHDVEIISNPENFYVVMVYDTIAGKKNGAVIEGYKAFYAKGQVESFLQTLPKQCLGISKNLGDKTSKLFFLSFDPFYVDFKHEDFSRRIDNEIKRVEENASMMVDLARASSVELKELSTVSKNDYSGVLGDPFILKMLASGSKGPTLARIDIGGKMPIDEEKIPLIQLGLSKTMEIMKEATLIIMRTQILGPASSLNYASYILSENLLLDNVPLVIFDDDNYFSQLSIASSNRNELKEERVEFEPMAFPVKEMTPKQNLKVSIKDADLIFALQILGVKDNEFEKNLSLFAFTAQVNSIEELLQKINDSKELGEYEKLRAERLFQIMNSEMGSLFGQSTPSEELIRAIPGRLGRAIIINTKVLSNEEKIIFIHTLLRQITKAFSQSNTSDCTIVLPKIDSLLESNKERVTTALLRASSRGLGLILGAEKELPSELNELLPARVSVVEGKDVAVMIKGKRTYRIDLRPSLSGQPKI
jgi:hypothetical protein